MNIPNVNVGIINLFITFVLSSVLGLIFLPILSKRKITQYVRTEGPKSHLCKAGIPTGAGIIFIIPIVLVGFCVTKIYFPDFWPVYIFLIVTLILFSLTGLADDISKLSKNQNTGLTVKQKLFLQFLFSLIIVIIFNNFFYHSGLHLFQLFINNKVIYTILLIFLLVGFTNASNLTDGLDGLLTIVSIVSFISLAVLALFFKNYYIYNFCMVTVGSLCGFLFFNKYPAKIFMGDTGSLGLGPLFVVVCYCLSLDFYIISLGIVYVIETISVILQVIYFKYTKYKCGKGKRVLLMSPYHHHLELKYNSELKATFILSLIAIIFCLITVIFLIFLGEF